MKLQEENLKSARGIFISAMQSGLFGFALFFSVELSLKMIAAFINPQIFFIVDIWDVYLSSIGFVLLFLIALLNGISQKSKAESEKVKIKPFEQKERESHAFIQKRKAV